MIENPGDTPLSYCANFRQVRERLCSLYERKATDRVFAVLDTPSAALEEFVREHEEGFCKYPDPLERIAFWESDLSRKKVVLDDGVPSAYLSECDQGLYGGMVGGEVEYMAHPENGWISSMVPPLLGNWSGFDSLEIGTDSEAFSRFQHQLETYLERSAGRFGISHFILIDGLNFAFELVGATETYMALRERPETVRRVIDFAFNLNVTVQEAFFNAGVLVEGGTCSNMVQWIPGRVISESIDPFHMTSIADFEEWGRGPVERIYSHYDGGVVHVHGNGRHLLEVASTLKGLKALYLGDDTGFPLAFDVLPEIRNRVGDLPLVVSCEYPEFVRALEGHSLTGGVLYQVFSVPDNDTANRLMDRVREYRC